MHLEILKNPDVFDQILRLYQEAGNSTWIAQNTRNTSPPKQNKNMHSTIVFKVTSNLSYAQKLYDYR